MSSTIDKLAELCGFKDVPSFCNRLEFDSELLEKAVNQLIAENTREQKDACWTRMKDYIDERLPIDQKYTLTLRKSLLIGITKQLNK